MVSNLHFRLCRCLLHGAVRRAVHRAVRGAVHHAQDNDTLQSLLLSR